MNVKDIVWKENNLDQKMGSNKKKGEKWSTIGRIHYHVTEVYDKIVHQNLICQLASSIPTKTNNMIHSGIHGHYQIHCDMFLGVFQQTV